ncbi:MAG: 50S ribosomal protein L19, partial [Nitrospirota bacterium]|nr:50S ribosomal protein L19 [Nitrospirota bacterium]
MNRLERIEKSLAATNRPSFTVGDTVRVHVKVVEGGKERIQIYEGLVIAKNGGSNRESFTVRKVSYNTGVERVFPLNSPIVDKIEVLRSGQVRRAKLYYLRERRGKAARIAEKDMRGKRAAEAAKAEAVQEAAAQAKASEEAARKAEEEAAKAKAAEPEVADS